MPTKSTVKKAAKSPVKKAAKSPVKKAAKSPVEKTAKSLVKKAAKSPVKKAAKKSPKRASKETVPTLETFIKEYYDKAYQEMLKTFKTAGGVKDAFDEIGKYVSEKNNYKAVQKYYHYNPFKMDDYLMDMSQVLNLQKKIVKILLPDARLLGDMFTGDKKNFKVIQLYSYGDYFIVYEYSTPEYPEYFGIDAKDLMNLAGDKFLPIDEHDDNEKINRLNGLKNLIKDNITIIKKEDFDLSKFFVGHDISDLRFIYEVLEFFYPDDPEIIKEELFKIAQQL
jgi:hypothetical protein